MSQPLFPWLVDPAFPVAGIYLGRFLGGEPIQARPAGPWERVWRWVRRRPSAAALLVVSLVALLSLVGIGVGLGYSSRLERSNRELEEARGELEQSNDRLQVASGEKENANRQLTQVNRRLAEANLGLQREKKETEKLRATADRLRYIAQVNLAHRLIREGRARAALGMLRQLTPRQDEEDLRGPEWYHVLQQCNESTWTVQGHKGRVTCLAYRPDGLWLASGGEDGTVVVREEMTGEALFRFQVSPGAVAEVVFCPAGRYLAALGETDPARVWDLERGQEVRWNGGGEAVGLPLVMKRYAEERRWRRGARHSVDVSPFVAQALPVRVVGVMAGSVWQRALVTATTLLAPTDLPFEMPPKVPVKSNVAVHAGKRLAAIGGGGGRSSGTGFELAAFVQVHDLTTGQRKWRHEAHEGSVRAVAFSPDGEWLATGGDDRTVLVSSADAGTGPHRELVTTSRVSCLAFRPDGWWVVAGRDDGSLRRWRREAHEEVALDCVDSSGYGCVGSFFSAEGTRLTGFGLQGWRSWDTRSGRTLHQGHEATPYRVGGLGPNHTLLAGTRLLELPLGKPRWQLVGRYSNVGFGMAFSPDGRLLVTTGNGLGQVWDAVTGKHLRMLPLPAAIQGGWLGCAAFSPDGSRLVVGNGHDNGGAVIFEVGTWKVVGSLSPLTYPVWALKYSPDGTILAAGCGYFANGPGEVKLWDAATGAELHTFRDGIRCVWELAFSPDGTRVAAATGYYGNKPPPSDAPREIKVLDIIARQELFSFRLSDQRKAGVLGVAYSPDGKSLTSAWSDGKVRLWGEIARRWPEPR